MCEGSIHARHRRASDKEELVIKTIPDTSWNGTYPAHEKEGTLVCVLPGTKMLIEKVLIINRPGVREYPCAIYWHGKEMVEAEFCTFHLTLAGRYADGLRMPNGQKIHLTWLQEGMRLNIGVPFKRDLDKALNLSNPDPDIALERAEEPINEANEHEANVVRRQRESMEGDD